jgi:UDP-N-acetylmuramoyl-L-alanyl-D-glutamate--2,6-diaminopimelate ligase
MRLKDFLTLQKLEQAEGDLDQEVAGLVYDSRRVAKGDVFFAVPGEKADGHRFVNQAIDRGAIAAVVTHTAEVRPGVTFVRVENVRATMGLWGAHFYRRPGRRLKLVGVTGTNGKTTTAYLIESILAAAGMEPGVIGTINYRYGGKEMPAHHTTPESLDLHALMAEMAQGGARSVVMEVSSHALVQERVRGVDFDVGVFTNLSRDHLDYHKNMDDYFVAKSRLFTDYLPASAKPAKAAVINGDDVRGRELLGKAQSAGLTTWSYGCGEDWDIKPLQVHHDVSGQSGKIRIKDRVIDFSSQLIGAANLDNILAAVGVGLALQIPQTAIVEGIKKLRSVPGRLQKIDNARGVAVLVDYAHTPDALEKVLGAIRPLTDARVLTVFGCGGDRDRGKRPMMGEIAARLSDVVVLTSDNPRSEDPERILQEIEAGMHKTAISKLEAQATEVHGVHGYCVEADRRKAIGLALSWAEPGDVVVIAGKGHEDYQILGAQKIHFDDREVAREILSSQAGILRT